MSKDKIEVSIKDIPEIIETLKEAEKEIEFERKSKNLFIDDLYRVCDMSLKQQQEIERLTELCNKYEEEHKTTFEIWQKDIKENEHLRTALNTKESIIKEVRDLVNKEEFTMKQKYVMREELLEILDKGE